MHRVLMWTCLAVAALHLRLHRTCATARCGVCLCAAALRSLLLLRFAVAGDQPGFLQLQGEDPDSQLLQEQVQRHRTVQPIVMPTRKLAVRRADTDR